MRADAFQSPFSSVLCPIDFSEHSRLALRYAALLARRSHGRLTVFFVNDPLLVAAAAAAYNEETLGAATQEELTRFVAESVPLAGETELQVEYRTEVGKPGREILRVIRQGEHDAVVLGTKGLNATQRLLLGSTTSEILRRTKVPVLAVPMSDPEAAAPTVPATWPGARILAPIALDEHAEADLRRAADIAAWIDASLDVVHVVPVPAMPAWFRGNMQGELEAAVEKAQAALDALIASVGVVCTAIVATGRPSDEVAREAAERNAGLVVMTLRGGEGMLGASIGSIAYGVLSHNVAPVLALPAADAAV